MKDEMKNNYVLSLSFIGALAIVAMFGMYGLFSGSSTANYDSPTDDFSVDENVVGQAIRTVTDNDDRRLKPDIYECSSQRVTLSAPRVFTSQKPTNNGDVAVTVNYPFDRVERPDSVVITRTSSDGEVKTWTLTNPKREGFEDTIVGYANQNKNYDYEVSFVYDRCTKDNVNQFVRSTFLANPVGQVIETLPNNVGAESVEFTRTLAIQDDSKKWFNHEDHIVELVSLTYPKTTGTCSAFGLQELEFDLGVTDYTLMKDGNGILMSDEGTVLDSSQRISCYLENDNNINYVVRTTNSFTGESNLANIEVPFAQGIPATQLRTLTR